MASISENESIHQTPVAMSSESAMETCNDLPHLSTREVEALYSSTLFAIQYRFGLHGEKTSPSRHQIHLYLKHVLDISSADHENILMAVEQMEPPVPLLNVTILAARGLTPKDSNGKSDPFCLMGCLPASVNNTSTSCCPKDLRALLLEKHLAAELVHATSIQKATLEPIWDEHFELEVEHTDSDVIQIEVWDHDEEASVLQTMKNAREISNLKAVGRFFKEVAKSARRDSASLNDFEGYVVIPTSSISCVGVEKWFPLQSKSASEERGELKLKLQWLYKYDEHAMHVVSAEQALQTLWYQCVHYEAKNLKNIPANGWSGQLSSHGQSILIQYPAQHSIPLERQAVSQWIAYSQACSMPIVQYKLALSLLQQMSCSSKPMVLDDEKSLIRGGLYRFICHGLDQLQKQHVVFPSTNVDSVMDLCTLLRCLNETYIFDKGLELGLYQAGIKPSVITAIKADICNWYFECKNIAEKSETTEDPENDITILAKTTQGITDWLKTKTHSLTHIYKTVMHIDYIDIVQMQIAQLLMEDVRSVMDIANSAPITVDEDEDSSSSLFQLYQALKRFNEADLIENRESPLPTHQFFLIFKKTVERWFENTKQISIERITKAVEVDKVKAMDEFSKHSTSPIDVTCCISQIANFWNSLQWPDPSGAYVFAAKVTDDICTCSVVYAHLMHKKLTTNGFFDTEGQFNVTDQLCISINNLEEVRANLKGLYDSLDLDDVITHLGEEHGSLSRNQCEQTLHTMLGSADDDMRNVIGHVVRHVGIKMRGDIQKNMQDIMFAASDVTADQVLVPILEYLDNNMTTLHNFLVDCNFRRILCEIWLVVINEIQQMVDAKKNNLHNDQDCVQRSLVALKTLQDFFYADSKGLDLNTMQCEEYSKLRGQLEHFMVSSEELIQNFFQAKLHEQEEAEDTELGIISVRCAFSKKQSQIQLQIMNATNLKPLDRDGQSDPYVVIQLQPKHSFPASPSAKTSVIKSTLHPIFDESFELNVTAPQCALPGSCIHLQVCDDDFIGHETEGEAFLDLSDIPGVEGAWGGSIDDLSVTSLPLMQEDHFDEADLILDNLRVRSKDKTAREFLKTWGKRKKAGGASIKR